MLRQHLESATHRDDTDDAPFPDERFKAGARQFPRPHATIKGAGHFLQEDKGEELARVIVNFVLTNS